MAMDPIEIYKPLSKVAKNGLYHGCWGICEDGTRRLITGNCSICRYPTNDPFWMDPKDVNFSIKTRSQKSKLKRPKFDEVIKYFTKTVEKTEDALFEIKPTDYEVQYMTVTY